MKKNVRNNVCVTVALVCLALVVLFAWLGCTGSSTALLVLSMAAGAGFVVAVNHPAVRGKARALPRRRVSRGEHWINGRDTK